MSRVEQIEGLPVQYTAKAVEPLAFVTRIERTETFFVATSAAIEHGGNRALYAPCADRIQVPPREGF